MRLRASSCLSSAKRDQPTDSLPVVNEPAGKALHPFKFESKHQGLLPLPRFLKRMGTCLLFAISILAVALGIGIAGYHFIAGFSWIDAFLNASMILTGMVPVVPLPTTP